MNRTVFINKELDKEFREKGYVVVDLLNDMMANRLLTAYKSISMDAGVPFYTTTWFEDVPYRHRTDRLIRDAVGNQLNGLLNDFDNLYSSFIIKKRGLKRRVGLHADWQFVEEPRFCAINVWIALEAIDAYSGSLQVVPGSHHDVSQLRGPNYALDPAHEKRKSELISVPVAKGQAILYDTRLLHASNPNLLKANRIVASALMIPKEAVAKYYYFDEASPEEPLHCHDVDRDFYLDECTFKRSVLGWPYSPPTPAAS